MKPTDGPTMVPRPDDPVFSAGGQTWCRRDVAAALDSASDAGAARHRLAREITARAMLGDQVAAEAVRPVIDGLRRDRRLLSRDDTEAWLGAHDLTTADLVAWAEGVVARRSLSLDEIDARLEQEPADPSELATRAWASLVFTGRYRDGAETLARGAAAWATTLESAAAATTPSITATPPGPRTLELAQRRLLATAAQDEAALVALVARRQFEWILVEGTRLVFASTDAAAEAARSLHDGRPLDELRAYATHAHSASIDIGSLDGPAQAAFAGAGAGDVLGPLATTAAGAGAEIEVWIISGRREPTLADPATRRRAAAEHAERTLLAAVTKQVRWHVDE